MSAVSLTAASLAAAVLGCAVAGALGQAAAARAGADAAADLAALAVASRVVRGEPHAAACAVGRTVAEAPAGPGAPAGARTVLTGCTVVGEVAEVQVTAELDLLGTTLTVVGRARAGPAGPADAPGPWTTRP